MSDNRTFFYGALGMNRLFAVLVLFCTVMATAQTLDTISTLEEIQLRVISVQLPILNPPGRWVL